MTRPPTDDTTTTAVSVGLGSSGLIVAIASAFGWAAENGHLSLVHEVASALPNPVTGAIALAGCGFAAWNYRLLRGQEQRIKELERRIKDPDEI